MSLFRIDRGDAESAEGILTYSALFMHPLVRPEFRCHPERSEGSAGHPRRWSGWRGGPYMDAAQESPRLVTHQQDVSPQRRRGHRERKGMANKSAGVGWVERRPLNRRRPGITPPRNPPTRCLTAETQRAQRKKRNEQHERRRRVGGEAALKGRRPGITPPRNPPTRCLTAETQRAQRKGMNNMSAVVGWVERRHLKAAGQE